MLPTQNIYLLPEISPDKPAADIVGVNGQRNHKGIVTHLNSVDPLANSLGDLLGLERVFLDPEEAESGRDNGKNAGPKVRTLVKGFFHFKRFWG
jgi:hypothetical protein